MYSQDDEVAASNLSAERKNIIQSAFYSWCRGLSHIFTHSVPLSWSPWVLWEMYSKQWKSHYRQRLMPTWQLVPEIDQWLALLLLHLNSRNRSIECAASPVYDVAHSAHSLQQRSEFHQSYLQGQWISGESPKLYHYYALSWRQEISLQRALPPSQMWCLWRSLKKCHYMRGECGWAWLAIFPFLGWTGDHVNKHCMMSPNNTSPVHQLHICQVVGCMHTRTHQQGARALCCLSKAILNNRLYQICQAGTWRYRIACIVCVILYFILYFLFPCCGCSIHRYDWYSHGYISRRRLWVFVMFIHTSGLLAHTLIMHGGMTVWPHDITSLYY